MISETAIRVVSTFLSYGCNKFRLFPYHWDEEKRRLAHASRRHLFLYNTHRWIFWVMTVWCYGRFIQAATWDNVTNRIRAIHSIWIFAYSLESLCYLQFQLKRQEIKYFVNSLFAYIEKHKGEHIEMT
jgi:hypothetical protein